MRKIHIRFNCGWKSFSVVTIVALFLTGTTFGASNPRDFIHNGTDLTGNLGVCGKQFKEMEKARQVCSSLADAIADLDRNNPMCNFNFRASAVRTESTSFGFSLIATLKVNSFYQSPNGNGSCSVEYEKGTDVISTRRDLQSAWASATEFISIIEEKAVPIRNIIKTTKDPNVRDALIAKKECRETVMLWLEKQQSDFAACGKGFDILAKYMNIPEVAKASMEAQIVNGAAEIQQAESAVPLKSKDPAPVDRGDDGIPLVDTNRAGNSAT